MPLILKVEKTIHRPVAEVFIALKSGLLFMNCSANSSSMKIDFRVGGRYHIDFRSMEKSNFGEFLEIIPNQKIVFTWCQAFGEDQRPDTQVTIDLAPEGSSTRLVLQHFGFKDQATCEAHIGGWTSGLNDMTAEIEKGQLRMVRQFSATVEKLFEACKTPSSFFGYMGDLSQGQLNFEVGGHFELPNKNGGVRGKFLEIEPAKKIKISWEGGCGVIAPDSQVTLLLHEKAKGSALELIHSGLQDTDTKMSHRQAWDFITEKMSETLGRRPS